MDNIVVDSLDWNSSDDYQFTYHPDLSTLGEIELRVMAEALEQPGNRGSDYITVSIEGILPKTGKH